MENKIYMVMTYDSFWGARDDKTFFDLEDALDYIAAEGDGIKCLCENSNHWIYQNPNTKGLISWVKELLDESKMGEKGRTYIGYNLKAFKIKVIEVY